MEGDLHPVVAAPRITTCTARRIARRRVLRISQVHGIRPTMAITISTRDTAAAVTDSAVLIFLIERGPLGINTIHVRKLSS
ncbi:hypothetical protein GCM10011320_31350 [Neoroseomonas lacus]|uniref:Uncharacterized protein n=1 Tax=Neoroseomonas lacus TaxID=287609 RepID=A0A917KS24_9PROT|nr:hypothetical protein GCM10011320_31350 [Neoroseomonas lacus]